MTVAVIDVGATDGNSQPPRFGNVNGLVIKAPPIGQASTEEGRRPVRFEIGRTIRDIRIGSGVALVEPIAGKSLDLLPQSPCLRRLQAGTGGRRLTTASDKALARGVHRIPAKVTHAAA